MKKLIRFVALAIVFFTATTDISSASMCQVYYSSGDKYTFCSTTQGNCNLVAPTLNPPSPRYAASNNESYRRAVRNICTQYSTWAIRDCTYLKPRYRTIEPYKTMYSLPYKQYIWDSCHLLPPLNWGARP